jgi:hypothetical protein
MAYRAKRRAPARRYSNRGFQDDPANGDQPSGIDESLFDAAEQRDQPDPRLPPDDEEPSEEERADLERLKASGPQWQMFVAWALGTTPLICHAWSQKAREDMLDSQQKTVKEKAPRDPQADYEASLYEIKPGVYGFPLGGLKDSIVSMAHKDKGLAQTVARQNIQMQAAIVQVRTALRAAKCWMPLVRIYGAPPEMREDMVRVGSGMRRTATLAYRGQIWPWAIRIIAEVNTKSVPIEAFSVLARDAGKMVGIGDWRPQKKGMFGKFRLASPDEAKLWEAYARGTGPMPPADSWEVTEEQIEQALREFEERYIAEALERAKKKDAA